MAKYLRLIIICGLSIHTGVHGYFEHVYQCTLSGATINISLQAKDRSYNCMQVVNFLYDKEKTYDSELETLYQYDQSQDTGYRAGIKQSLTDNQTKTQLLRQKIISSMQSFEQDLLIKVKKIIIYKLNPEFIIITRQHAITNKKLQTMIQQGDKTNIAQIHHTLQQYTSKLIIRHGIKTSQDFVTLMVYLQLYKAI